MHTVFSHIIQKRFSQVNEDVATDALAYVLESSESARRGMSKFLSGIAPDLPPLRFRTQQAAGTIRPDMWGFADGDARLFVESKFWAGLTDNQPVAYLQQLAEHPQPTMLLVIAPAAREHTLWRDLCHRLADAGIALTERDDGHGAARSASTGVGPVLALTSWSRLLSALEHEAADDPAATGDLAQLRALCTAADQDAYTPASREMLSDQRTPAFILQLGSVVREAVDLAVAENVLNVNGLRPQANWQRTGQYVRVGEDAGAGAWFGTEFALWKLHGAPLWLIFEETDWGRAPEVRGCLEHWAAERGWLTTGDDSRFAITLDLAAGEEKAGVLRALVDQLQEIHRRLGALGTRTTVSAARESDLVRI